MSFLSFSVSFSFVSSALATPGGKGVVARGEGDGRKNGQQPGETERKVRVGERKGGKVEKGMVTMVWRRR